MSKHMTSQQKCMFYILPNPCLFCTAQNTLWGQFCEQSIFLLSEVPPPWIIISITSNYHG